MRADGSIPLSVSYVITDARGSGAGWRAQATFTSTDAIAYPTSETLENVNGAAALPQTPTALGSTPLTPIEHYVEWTREDGQPFDRAGEIPAGYPAMAAAGLRVGRRRPVGP